MTAPIDPIATDQRSARVREVVAIAKLAGPIAILQVAMMTTTSIGTMVTGRYSASAQAGAALGSAFFFGIMVIGLGLVLGFDPIFSQALGAGERLLLRSHLRAAIRFGAWCSVPLMLLQATVALLLPSMGFEPDVAIEARGFLLARTPSLVVLLMSSATRAYLQAHERTRPLLAAALASNLVMLPAALYFVHELHLGALGTGLAGALATSAILLVETIAVRNLHAETPVEPDSDASTSPAAERVERRALRVGAPLSMQLFAEVSAFAGTTVLMGYFGTRTLAAHQIAMEAGSLSFQVVLALGIAASVRVGQAIGRGDLAAARRAGTAAITLGLAFNAVATVFFLIAADYVTRAFNPDPAMLEIARPFLRIVAFFQLVDGLQTISAGALRGAGDTRASMIANLAGHYTLGMPVGLFLTYVAQAGPIGLWVGLTLGLVVVALVLTLRFFRLTSRDIARV